MSADHRIVPAMVNGHPRKPETCVNCGRLLITVNGTRDHLATLDDRIGYALASETTDAGRCCDEPNYVCVTCGDALSASGSIDAERLARAWTRTEMTDERLGVVGRGRFVDRLAAEYARLSESVE